MAAAGFLAALAAVCFTIGCRTAALASQRLSSSSSSTAVPSRRLALQRVAFGSLAAVGAEAAVRPAAAEIRECTNPVACGPIVPKDGGLVVSKTVSAGEEEGWGPGVWVPAFFFTSYLTSVAYTKVREMMNKGKEEEVAAARAKELTESPDFAKYVQMETVTPGNGTTFPKPGATIAVHYVGTLLDGTKFDSSRDRGSPLRFPIATGRVIKGWDAAVLKMSQGETARITIQPEWAYGARAVGSIPPNSTLVFEVELLQA